MTLWYSIIVDTIQMASDGKEADLSGFEPESEAPETSIGKLNKNAISEKLEQYLALISLEQKSGKWERRIRKWLTDFINNCNPYNVLETTNYLKSLQEHYSVCSYKKVHFQIRKFLRDFLDLHYLDKIKLQRVKPQQVKTITNADIKKTLEYFANDKDHARYKAMILLLSSSGIRPSELFQLRKEDFDLENRILHIRVDDRHHTKTGKARTVFFTEKAKTALQKYFSKNRNRVLFNESMTMRAFRNAPMKVKEFRKAFSQEATKRNLCQPIKERLLGHSLQSVDDLHYLTLTTEDLKKAYDKAFGEK
jgi:integrase